MTDQRPSSERPGDVHERRRQWDEWVASEKARHAGKDHEFEPDRDFDEHDLEGHGMCRACT